MQDTRTETGDARRVALLRRRWVDYEPERIELLGRVHDVGAAVPRPRSSAGPRWGDEHRCACALVFVGQIEMNTSYNSSLQAR
jgi:hypothetical protein